MTRGRPPESRVSGREGVSPPRPRSARRAGALLPVLLAAAVFADAPRGEVRPLTLYQKTARASLVALVRATSDSTRRPPLEVLEVLKGSYAAKTLYIVPFFQDYANPKPWLQREVFRKGEKYFLFLVPYDENRDDDAFPEAGKRAATDGENEDRHLFVVLNANQGVLDVPAEGGTAIADALERFSAILAMDQYDDQANALRALLAERNPYMIEAGLTETERFHLEREEDVPVLVGLLGSPRGAFRSGAARLLGDLAGRSRQAGTPLQRQAEVLERLGALARTDEDPEVRVAGVQSLVRLGSGDAEALLEAIAREDPSQDVRYAAEVGLIEMTGEPIAPGPRRGGSPAP